MAEIPTRLGITAQTAEWHRRRAVEERLIFHLDSGQYGIAPRGEEYLARWGPGNPSDPFLPNPSGGTDLWYLENARFKVSIKRANKSLSPTRYLGKTPIHAFTLEAERVRVSVEAWGDPPKTVRFYLNRFPILGAKADADRLLEAIAREAIKRAKDTLKLPLGRDPEWLPDPRGFTDEDPPPSGHFELAVPEFRGVIRRMVNLTNAADFDLSGDLISLAVYGGAEFEEARRALEALRLGRFSDYQLEVKDAIRSLQKAIIALAKRLDRMEADS